jgi:hypothetical protein
MFCLYNSVSHSHAKLFKEVNNFILKLLDYGPIYFKVFHKKGENKQASKTTLNTLEEVDLGQPKAEPVTRSPQVPSFTSLVSFLETLT